MALTRGTIGAGEVSDASTEELAFDVQAGDTPCTTIMVRCVTTSASAVRVRIEGLHNGVAVGEGVLVPVGEREYFRLGERNGIRKMYLAGDTDVITVDWGPVASINIQSL